MNEPPVRWVFDRTQCAEGRCQSRRVARPRCSGVLTMTSQHARISARHAATAYVARHSARRRTALWAVPALLLGLLPAALVAVASSAGAAADPSQINFTLEGCRNT